MTIWAVEARYPADMPEVLESDAKRALKIANEIIQLTEEDIREHFTPATDTH